MYYIEEEWYENRVVGRDMCDRFMKLSLAKSVQLDGDYTNHSICATVITTLDKEGFEACHIIKLSSHKSESTVKEYSTKCPENKWKEMFDSLTNAMHPKQKKAKTVAKPPSPKQASNAPSNIDIDIHDIKDNLPRFDLQEIYDFDTIDHSLLVQIITEETDKENSNKKTNQQVATTPQGIHQMAINSPKNSAIQQQTQQINNQFNMPPQFHFPGMFFPNSNVTINYNFGKWAFVKEWQKNPKLYLNYVKRLILTVYLLQINKF